MAVPRKIVDKDGGFFMVGDGGDVWFPPFPLKNSFVEQLKIIQSMNIKDDDVIMTGYGKSGSHWHFEILSMLQRGKAEYVPQSKAHQMVDAMSTQFVDSIPSPRILNTHVLFRYLPTQALEKKTKIVVLVRNPKDACVSMFNHMRDWNHGGYNGTWDNFVEMFLDQGVWYGNWFTTMLDWEKEKNSHPELPIFFSHYEHLHRDPAGHIQRLANFLELPASPQLCQDIADKCCFSKLKEASSTVKTDAFPPGTWKDGSPGFFRKGEVGDWKNWLTPAQNTKFDQVYNSYMKDSKLDIVFEL